VSEASRHKPRGAGIALTIGAATVMTACSSGSSGTSHPPVTTSVTRSVSATSSQVGSPSATGSVESSPPDVRTLAVQIYLAMWADMVQAGKTADYQSPQLAQHATSQAYLLLRDGLLKAHQSNLIIKGQPVFTPTVTGVRPATSPVAVSILDCIDDSHWLNYTPDGRLQNDTPGGKHHTTATVGLLNGQWLVTHLEIGQVGSCN
jgi:hypothetical protein